MAQVFWPEKDKKSRVTVPLKVKKNVDSRESDIADFFIQVLIVLYCVFICKKNLPEYYGRVAVNFFTLNKMTDNLFFFQY